MVRPELVHRLFLALALAFDKTILTIEVALGDDKSDHGESEDGGDEDLSEHLEQ